MYEGCPEVQVNRPRVRVAGGHGHPQRCCELVESYRRGDAGNTMAYSTEDLARIKTFVSRLVELDNEGD